MSRTVAIIQARIGSSRLPGKILRPLLGVPILTRVVERTRRARLVDDVVVATTTLAADDVLANLAEESDWALTRGSETDLLDRYLTAAAALDADVIVRITSDCPLIDPELVDLVVHARSAAGADYAANSLEPRTFPRGLDVEVFTRSTLERANAADKAESSREHVTPYIYRHPELFRLARIASTDDQSGHRWCVDTEEDYELVRRIYETIGSDRFGWREALGVIQEHPHWADLNRHVVQKSVPIE